MIPTTNQIFFLLIFIFSIRAIFMHLFSPSDPNFHYMGRFDKSVPSSYTFNWPTSTIFGTFEGSSITIHLTSLDEFWFAFYVDGVLHDTFNTISTQDTYVFNGFSTGIAHSFNITQRSENGGICQFKGVEVNQLLPTTKTFNEKIIFFGDSYTCGYGNLGANVYCPYEKSTSNSVLTYGVMVSKLFNFEFHQICRSGHGMVRNYGELATTSASPLPFYVDKTYIGGSNDWNWAEFTPDYISIFLGLNDFSTDAQYHPNQLYVTAYNNFISKLRSLYPNLKQIFVISYDYQETVWEGFVRDIAQANNVEFINFFGNLTTQHLGCHYHPNVEGNKILASILASYIRKYVNDNNDLNVKNMNLEIIISISAGVLLFIILCGFIICSLLLTGFLFYEFKKMEKKVEIEGIPYVKF